MGDIRCWSSGGLEVVPNFPASGSSRRDPIIFKRRRRRQSSAGHVAGGAKQRKSGCLSLSAPCAKSLPRACDDYYTAQTDS